MHWKLSRHRQNRSKVRGHKRERGVWVLTIVGLPSPALQANQAPVSFDEEQHLFKVPPPIYRPARDPSPPMLELHVTQQPPSEAVYQRILRPFPTITVCGPDAVCNMNSLFVEVSLLKQEDFHVQGVFENALSTKSGVQMEGEKKNLLIGGQLVQRSELGPQPDTLIVVFRKLKILTTTAQQVMNGLSFWTHICSQNIQQGGAFFLLRFSLNRYVDNRFEAVPNVPSVISDPIEVFSHTLYLKGRNNVPQRGRHASPKTKLKLEPKDDETTPSAKNKFEDVEYPTLPPQQEVASTNQGYDALSSLAAVSVANSGSSNPIQHFE